MNDLEIKETLHERKEQLEEHLNKYNKLKAEGNWSAAWEQLTITLTYATETLKCSANILKDIKTKLPDASNLLVADERDTLECCSNDTCDWRKDDKKKIPKMIVVPKSQQVH